MSQTKPSTAILVHVRREQMALQASRPCHATGWLYRLCPCLIEAAVVFKPETLARWHRSGLRLYWRCKSRRRVGRAAVPADIRDLIRTIGCDNPLWGAPAIARLLCSLWPRPEATPEPQPEPMPEEPARQGDVTRGATGADCGGGQYLGTEPVGRGCDASQADIASYLRRLFKAEGTPRRRPAPRCHRALD